MRASNTLGLGLATRGRQRTTFELRRRKVVIRLFGGNSGSSWTDQGLIAEVRAYWEALRQDSALPKRHQIDPRGIAGALENVFLIERIGTGIAQFRIAGFAFHDLMGMDVRGMPFSCLFIGEAQIQLRMYLERAFTGPAAVHMSLSSARSYNQPELSAKLAILPVADAMGSGTLALGCIEISGQIRKTPRRFQIDRSQIEAIRLPEPPVLRPLQAVRRPLLLEPFPETGAIRTTQKPKLRLVHSSD